MIVSYEHAQAAVIGTIFIKDEVLDDLTVDIGLVADDFTEPYRDVFEAMVELYDKREPVTVAAVAHHLGVPRDDVATFADPVPVLSEYRTYGRIVQEQAQWQRREEALSHASAAIVSNDEEAFEKALASLEKNPRVDQSTFSGEALASEFYDWLDDKTVTAIPTGFADLDEALAGGFRRGDTTIVAAWTSIGKSVLVDQILENAFSVGYSTCVYVNEMDRLDRVARTVARLSNVPYHRLARKDLTKTDAVEVVRVLKDLPSTLVEVPGWSAQKIARHIRQQKVDIAAIDLVTRIPAKDTSEWDVISGTLTDAARQSGTHLLLVCQLNQERNKTAVKPPPVGRDLRNTGSWQNDAANVVFLHREQEVVEGMGFPRVLEDGHIRVEKSRHGQGGFVAVKFNSDRMRFDCESPWEFANTRRDLD